MNHIEEIEMGDDFKFSELDDAAGGQLLVLPNFFEQGTPADPSFPSTLPTFLKLAKKNKLTVRVMGNPDQPTLIENRGGEWYGPTIFISSLLYTQNPQAISVALGMISNYLSTIFPDDEKSVVSLNFIARKTKLGTIRKFEYRGPAKGLSELPAVIESFLKDDRAP